MPFPVQAIAERQWRDYRTGAPGSWFAEPGPAVTLSDAYAVQDAVTRLRVATADIAIGYKVGCTGPGTTEQFGMTGPISGRLFRSELRSTDVTIEARAHANLAIEGEMAVRIGPDGRPAEMFPIIELHNFVFRRPMKTLAELVANNGLHAGIVMPRSPWPMPIDRLPPRHDHSDRWHDTGRGQCLARWRRPARFPRMAHRPSRIARHDARTG